MRCTICGCTSPVGGICGRCGHPLRHGGARPNRGSSGAGWAAVAIVGVVGIAVLAAGGIFLARGKWSSKQVSKDSAHDGLTEQGGVVVVANAKSGRAVITPLLRAPSPPEGLTPIGKTYEISLPTGNAQPAFVSLPIADASVEKDPLRALFVGHYDGRNWEILPAGVKDGKAYAEVLHLSEFTVLSAPKRAAPRPGEHLKVPPPNLWGIEVKGDHASAWLDTTVCMNPVIDGVWRDGVALKSLRVYMSRPQAGRPMTSPSLAANVPYQVKGQDLYVHAIGGGQEVPLEFDLGSSMNVDATSTPAPRAWLLRVAPIFMDNTEGDKSEPLFVPAEVAEAQIKLRKGLMARMSQDQASRFANETTARPYWLFYNAKRAIFINLDELYSQATGGFWNQFSTFINTGQNVLHINSFIGIRDTSDWDRVISHEWGHYATNITLGDAAFGALGGGKHKGWTEASSRSLAWSEDLANYLGQYGAERGVAAGAGAMDAQWMDFSRHPSGNEGPFWPNANMDATLVESVPATVLSRMTRRIGFPAVYGVLRDSKPADIVDFFERWQRPADIAELQDIYLDERVAWKVEGSVIDEAHGRPLSRVRIQPEAMTGKHLSPVLHTGPGGAFASTAPPGVVRYVVDAPDCESRKFQFTVSTVEGTTAPPQAIPPFTVNCTHKPKPPPPKPAQDRPDAGKRRGNY